MKQNKSWFAPVIRFFREQIRYLGYAIHFREAYNDIKIQFSSSKKKLKEFKKYEFLDFNEGYTLALNVLSPPTIKDYQEGKQYILNRIEEFNELEKEELHFSPLTRKGISRQKNILEIILRDSDLSQHKAIESSQIFEKFKYLDSLGYSLIDGVKDGPKTLEIIGGRMRELGYLDENNNATKNFSNRFLGTLKKIFDSPTFYKWHEEINTIPERLYIISNHYGKNCNLDKGGNVNGSYKEEISKKNKEDLIEIFEGILDISQVLKSPGKSSR